MMNAVQTTHPEDKVLSDHKDACSTPAQREQQLSAGLEAAERAFRCAFCQTELKSDTCPTCEENKSRTR